MRIVLYFIFQVLQYLARAYYKAGKLKEAKATLLKARRVAPQVKIYFIFFKLNRKFLVFVNFFVWDWVVFCEDKILPSKLFDAI
jgi:hypothetical protein